MMNRFTKRTFHKDNGRVTWQLPNGVLHHPTRAALLFRSHKIIAYYQCGVLHRVGGPAYILNGRYISAQFYYHWGLLHREDGYAVEFSNGQKLMYIEGKKYKQ